MMNLKTIVVIGGGYAGINLIAALKKELNEKIRVILVDKNDYHFKKVKLFKGIVNEDVSNLCIPLKQYCGNIHFIQGELTGINQDAQTINITSEDGTIHRQEYDQLVLALGSVLREVDSNRGGVPLVSLKNARDIRQQLLKIVVSSKNNIRLAVVGGGITGIETAAEVNSWFKEETKKRGISKNIELFLINGSKRLLNEAPVKVSSRLERRLNEHGIQTFHRKRAERFIEGKVSFTDGSKLDADFCIWTVGLKPHPSLSALDIPLTEDGKIKVDPWYRLVGSENIYGIGDCVHAVDPNSGMAADMSCKEAISQAERLAKILRAHMEGHTVPAHQNFPDFLSIGLGPNDGFVWARKWGLDVVFCGKPASKIREYTWELASKIN
ncbi:FAD-dependent oxidoreductase [Mesobacillus sp. AQ2]|uniref:NAD(P)/FAD-dependent oxidoreductase n=1 Tax=Mesobacillus sp. AQ2 TaxID=3043332 RepID=UPI0024C11A28|nr:FAD-dependent oxidoreductase [Mesobacillus sp. AQ2]WHX41292.1 FAD-dependent oxidoreductase [Mesobacillus sp. AQ2]